MTSALAPDQLAQLVPLLGSLARMLARSFQVNDSSLSTLLLGAGLEENPHALEELRRWSRLLTMVQQHSTEAQRQATVEALLMRGLPEAAVMLAVASVAGSGADAPQAAPPTVAPVHVQTSVATLDFGMLGSGQGAVRDLEVQGGPGHVVVESDQVRVTPAQFGAGVTRLRVEVGPLASGLLWTALKLVTTGTSLEVPVIAQWQEAPAARNNQPVLVPTTASVAKAPAVPPWVATLRHVPAGPFLMGSSDADRMAYDDEKPQHTVMLPAYWIGTTPVTNAQFRPFVEGDGYTNPVYWTEVGWAWREGDKIIKPSYWDDATWNGDDYPVVGVSWFEAVAYCRWLSTQTGHEFHLPTEAEWEKAARGPDGRIWPWGKAWESGRCNSKEAGHGHTTPIGQYATGASPYGVLDMVGNVSEWCVTQSGKRYPYQLEDEWQAAYLEADKRRIQRGGSWDSLQKFIRVSYRYFYFPRDRFGFIGLRVASHAPLPGAES
ncbi:formylglycine-generating enzyme family protein [Candidatus Chloroploca sp. M-50]|uniref:Formylglycine-generating enzyme family protein n=1 Tax=Candidatus Chloroploca mongolica TaxID=2528176 RepID=A0ABS4DH87_9CHLR|nr:formylglycine-generating enzyme family protein [Candidatus Chloroploca mongolica]MBP1468800.1 formylglycine-generating enzyme family protein [Candidatus Chloroploca mongolica]